jgi:hypothetical protein
MMARPVTQNIRRQRTQAVATQIAGFSISARMPALQHSVRLHVDPERGELTIARDPTLEK